MDSLSVDMRILARDIQSALDEIIHDDRYPTAGTSIDTLPAGGNIYVDASRRAFLEGKRAELKARCHADDWNAIVYAGYDFDTDELRFWPDDERAQVAYLAGYSALEGFPISLKDIMYLVL